MTQYFDEEKLKELKEKFAVLAGGINGKIDVKMLGILMEDLGHSLPENELEEMIKEIDLDGNGNIDFNEFVLMMEKKMREHDTEAELNEAFKVLDRDSNGYISPMELKHVMLALGEKVTDEEVEDMIKEADIDGDGHINYQEFIRIMINK